MLWALAVAVVATALKSARSTPRCNLYMESSGGLKEKLSR